MATISVPVVLSGPVMMNSPVIAGDPISFSGSADIDITTLIPVLEAAGFTFIPTPPFLNTIDRVLYMMNGPHEGQLNGVDLTLPWALTPVVGQEPNLQMLAINGWGLIYLDANFDSLDSANADIQIEVKNIESYTWDIANGDWDRAQFSITVAGDYYIEGSDFKVSTPVVWNAEPDGGASTTMVPGCNLMVYPTGPYGAVAPNTQSGVFVTYQIRLIGDDATSAHILANAGADWWKDVSVGTDTTNSINIGSGRFVYLTPDWQAISFWSGGLYALPGDINMWTDTMMKGDPPPLDALGLPDATVVP